MATKSNKNSKSNSNQFEQITLAPASLPQEQFLESNSVITLYSGSAGAGKTFALVLNMVKFAAEQNSTIICFRRTSTQIRSPGSIWAEASIIFMRMFPDAKIRHRDLEIYIPSTNSIVKFAHLQHISDVNNHLGSQYSAVFFDEAVTFEPFEEFILPLMGRMRNANVNYEPQMFWATNPKFGNGIYEWIKDFYLDHEGIPLAEKSNIERYFVLDNSKPVWYDTREEAERIHGTGINSPVRSFRSIRAHVTDNKPLLLANPSYLANLKSMSTIKKRIYLDGSWTAREEEAGYFKREFCKVVAFPNYAANRRVRSWDLSACAVSSANPSPDWTRGVLVSKDRTSIYTVEDMESMRDRPHEVEQLIYRTARADPPGTIVTIPVDPGQAGIAYANALKVKLSEMGVVCRLVKTNNGKLTRFLPFSAISEAGHVNFVDKDYLDEMFEELERFDGTRKCGKDDICDSLSDAILVLNQGIEIPSFSLPDLSSSPTFNFQSGLTIPQSGLSLP